MNRGAERLQDLYLILGTIKVVTKALLDGLSSYILKHLLYPSIGLLWPDEIDNNDDVFYRLFILIAIPSDELEYVLLNRIELWEIDYSKRSAIEVSEVVQKDLLKRPPIEYEGSIVDFLNKKKNCKNIHYHTSSSSTTNRVHAGSCTFDM